MPSFGIGINSQKTNAGDIRGNQIEVACLCWFTSQGRTIPQYLKFVDEEGVLQTINELTVKHMEQKNYSGISTKEYLCTFSLHNTLYEVKLIYFMSNCKWVMIFI